VEKTRKGGGIWEEQKGGVRAEVLAKGGSGVKKRAESQSWCREGGGLGGCRKKGTLEAEALNGRRRENSENRKKGNPARHHHRRSKGKGGKIEGRAERP